MTPNCMEGMPAKTQAALDHEYTHCKGRKYPNNLRDQIAVDEGERIWPPSDILPSPRSSRGGYTRDGGDPSKQRPTLEGLVKNMPSPRASDHKNGSDINSKSHKYMLKKSYLTASVNESEGRSGQLNPDWTEILMGWPPGWTSLEPLPPEVWDMWQRQFRNWWPAHGIPFEFERDGFKLTGRVAAAWHCLELIYPRLTTIKEHRTNRLMAIGNGQVPQTKVMAIKSHIR